MGTQAESDAALVHCAWDQLAQTAPQLATALELREYGRLNVRGVATAMGRSLQTGAFYLRMGEVHLARSLRRGDANARCEK